MPFNEKVHAFIPAKFYVYLNEAFRERGVRTFIHATQHYAGQRGRRMAQKALRDGKELTYETYMEYGEWVNTPEIIESNQANQVMFKESSPDYVIHITRCPWQIQFKEMGLTEAGREYCAHLDSALCRGFNPYLIFEVEQTLHDSDCCVQKILNVNLPAELKVAKKKEYLQSFEYHCAHSYWAYSEVTASVFGAKGEAINAKVIEDFSTEYGQEMADALMRYRYVNFNVIP